jgi:integrase
VGLGGPMKAALSAKAIENAKPEAKRYAIPDVGHPGLRVLVYPSGAKSFTYRFKRDNGQDMTVVLGPASGPGAITLVQARDAAREARRQRSQGADPADQKRAARKAEMARIEMEERAARRRDDTVEKVLLRYYADHADHLKSGKEIRRVLDRELKSWSKRPVDDIQRRDAIRVLDAVKVRAPVQSQRLRAYGRHFYGWCIAKEITATNPFEGTVAIKERSRDRVLTDDELRLLLRGIGRLQSPRREFLSLLLMTGQRLSEIAEMAWSEISRSGELSTWVLPSGRAKNGNAHTIPLSPAAAEALSGMDRILGSQRVFATFSESHVKHCIDRAMLDVAREDAAASSGDPDAVVIEHWRLHDLRRTMATKMAELGVEVGIIERVLNHTMRGVMAVYQRYSFDKEKRHALSVWADFLTRLTAPHESNIIPFKAGA